MKLGLYDSMSKFFSPSSSNRHHDAFFAFIGNGGNKMPSAESNLSSHKLMMARKIVKRTRAKKTGRPMGRASSLPTSEVRGFMCLV